jgi:hypothetical protein
LVRAASYPNCGQLLLGGGDETLTSKSVVGVELSPVLQPAKSNEMIAIGKARTS